MNDNADYTHLCSLQSKESSELLLRVVLYPDLKSNYHSDDKERDICMECRLLLESFVPFCTEVLSEI